MTTHVCPLCGSEVRQRGGNQGIAHLDGFCESLRLLVEVERYSLRDIAAMFDVSGERIRQIAARVGIDTREHRGLCDYRVWDDSASRFIPIRRGELRRRKEKARVRKNRAAYIAKWTEREARAVATLRTLGETLGRAPTIRELGNAMGIPSTNVGTVAAYVERYKDVRNLWKRAGLELLAVGHRADESGRKGPRACK